MKYKVIIIRIIFKNTQRLCETLSKGTGDRFILGGHNWIIQRKMSIYRDKWSQIKFLGVHPPQFLLPWLLVIMYYNSAYHWRRSSTLNITEQATFLKPLENKYRRQKWEMDLFVVVNFCKSATIKFCFLFMGAGRVVERRALFSVP